MKHKFTRNNNYYTICIYAIFTILIVAMGIKIIINWNETLDFMSTLMGVLTPFLAGLLIAYLINPIAKFINEKILKKAFRIKPKTFRKVISILLSYIIIFGLISTMLFYIIPQVADTLSQIATFVDTAQTGYNKLIVEIKEIEAKNPNWDLGPVYDFVKDIPNVVGKFITESLPQIVPTIFTTSVSLISGVINAVIAIIVSIYMLIDKPHLINNSKKFVYSVFGDKKGDRIVTTASECNRIFGGFIIGKMFDSIIIGFICWIAMIALDLPYALVISVVVGVTNMIPYFGPFIGAIPGVLLLIIVDLKYAVIFTVLIIILQQFDGLYLGPKILGESTGLRPIWIIFAITVGGWLAGVIGMFLGVPVVAVIAYLLEKQVNKKLIKRKIVFEVDEETDIISREDMIVDETEYQVIIREEIKETSDQGNV